MRSSKDDRRVKYTKMVLRESFIDLLREKDISQISIKEICEKADINRATFYAHYSDQYDLMQKIEAELFENIETYLGEYRKGASEATPVEMVELIFNYIRDNAKLCRLLLSERGNLNFQKRIMNMVYDKNVMDLNRIVPLPREESEYIDAFIITGCIGVIQKWLDEDMQKSAKYMADLLIQMNVLLAGLGTGD